MWITTIKLAQQKTNGTSIEKRKLFHLMLSIIHNYLLVIHVFPNQPMRCHYVIFTFYLMCTLSILNWIEMWIATSKLTHIIHSFYLE